jgi:hypothetical protein
MEKRAFRAHNAILRSVIRHQSNELPKAVAEAAMNGIDAGATKIAIQVSPERIQITDNGHGFRGREEVYKFFETFGQPHAKGDAVYGRFRMGRGQLFNMGRNVWRSNGLELVVDIGADDGEMGEEELGYTITDNPAAGAGCSIDVTLYEPMKSWQYGRIESEVSKFVRHVEAEVAVNGHVITKNPKKMKWALQTDDAYFQLNHDGASNLAVFNLGIFVKDIPRSTYGVGGTVVSKGQLLVNFARNEVMGGCGVWKKISQTLRENGEKRAKRKLKIGDDEMAAISPQLVTGALKWEDYMDVKLFKLSDESYVSLNSLRRNLSWKRGNRFSFAEVGDRVADKLHQQEVAVVFDRNSFAQFGVEDCDPARFFDVILVHCKNHYMEWNYVPMKVLAATIDSSGRVLEDKDLRKTEELLLNVLSEMCRRAQAITSPDDHRSYRIKHRRVYLGESDVAYGWTDGKTRVVIAREAIKKYGLDEKGFMQLALLMLHEVCHGEPDNETHTHGKAFYALFHEHSYKMAEVAMSCYRTYLGKLSNSGRLQTKRDRVKEIKRKEAEMHRVQLEGVAAAA